MELITVLIAAVVFIAIYLWFQSDDPNLPPCPMRPLPIVGHIFHMHGDSRPDFKKWNEQCGDIYSLYMGKVHLVVLNGFDLIKDALVKNAAFSSDRPPFYYDQAIGLGDTGVIFSSGDNWKEQRTVSLSILRSFGMGKNLLTEKIQEEVAFYIDFLANLKGKPIDILNITSVSTCNIICSILVNNRFEYDDHDFKTVIESQNVLVSSQHNLSLINYAYWLKYIPGDYFNAKKLVTSLKAVMNSLGKFVDAKKGHFGDSTEVSDLIDAYNKEKNKKIQTGVSTFLDKKNLIRTMMDLFQGGSDTTSVTICWVILYMLNYPEIQEKVYQEIKDKVGTDRTPTMQDKNQLVYLNAVIHETQRLASIIPLSVTHFCSETMTLRGYTIPKGTYILTNLDSVLHDKDTWGADAMSFRPERFIDDNGKLKVPEQFIPFGIGRRICLGESLAKTGLFLYMASMFQRFHFLPSNPNSIPELKYQGGLIVATVPYEVKMVDRR